MIPWKIVSLKVLPGYRLEVVFADGVRGITDMSNDMFDGVFAPLKEPAYFAQATLVDGVVTWPNGVDIAPDAMHEELLMQQAA